MKITIVSLKSTQNDKDLIFEGKKRGHDCEITNVGTDILNNPEKYNFGDVVIWRSSRICQPWAKASIINLISKDRVVINRTYRTKPLVGSKYFQQKMVERYTDIKTINTYVFESEKYLLEAIRSGKINFPFIAKPNIGAKGEGIFLIKDQKDISFINKKLNKYIFQDYINNDGDYRIFLVGNRPLGVIKRIAQKNNFLNNISKGGMAKNLDDKILVKYLEEKSPELTRLFDLDISGIDFIKDKKTGEIYFMELNTVPQWQGFQEATGLNVAREIIKYCEKQLEKLST